MFCPLCLYLKIGVDPSGTGDRSTKYGAGVTNFDAPKVSASYVHLCIRHCGIMLYLPSHAREGVRYLGLKTKNIYLKI